MTTATPVLPQAQGGHRGCGNGRTQGGIYIESASSVGAQILPNVEDFLIDVPKQINPQQMGVSPLGMSLHQDTKGVYHLLDWVGSSHYPFISDFIEEARVMGISRKASPQLEWHLLTMESTLILVHAKAVVKNASAFSPQHLPNFDCPTGQFHYPNEGCIGIHLHLAPQSPDTVGRRRKVGQLEYPLKQVKGAPAAEYLPGKFMRLPISGIAVIAGNGSSENLRKASKSKLRVYLTEE